MSGVDTVTRSPTHTQKANDPTHLGLLPHVAEFALTPRFRFVLLPLQRRTPLCPNRGHPKMRKQSRGAIRKASIHVAKADARNCQ